MLKVSMVRHIVKCLCPLFVGGAILIPVDWLIDWQGAGHIRAYINIADINADALSDIPLSVRAQDATDATVNDPTSPRKGLLFVW